MRVIPAISVTAANGALAATNIPEPTGNTAYAAGTTYAASVQVVYNKYSYVSLQAGNIGHQPDTSPTWWFNIGPQPWVNGATYTAGDVVSSAHRTYLCATGLTSATAPASDTGHWTDTGPTNTWAMYDGYSSTQSTYPTTIDQTITATGLVDSLALMNISAASVQIIMSTVADGVVLNQTYSLIDDAPITDSWAYCFYPISRKVDAFITNLPMFNNPTVEVILTDTAGAVVKLGSMIMGQSQLMGGVNYGAQLGITDYSVKSVDAFGNYTITKRSFARRGTFTATILTNYVDATVDYLATLRSTPTLYVASDSFTSSMIYGFYKDFTAAITSVSHSTLNIEIEGLT